MAIARGYGGGSRGWLPAVAVAAAMAAAARQQPWLLQIFGCELGVMRQPQLPVRAPSAAGYHHLGLLNPALRFINAGV